MRRGAVRLVAGRQGGRSLAVPPGVRPTARRVREALFSIWGGAVDGARFLDLFAGSGVVGAEAISRGALSACFVDSRRPALAALRANLAALGLGPEARIFDLALPAGLSDRRLAAAGPYDLIFADPPYRFAHLPALLGGLGPLLAAGGEAVLEHSSRVEAPAAAAGLLLRESRRYGESRLTFYTASEALSS